MPVMLGLCGCPHRSRYLPIRAYQYSSGAKTNVPPKPHSKGAFNFSQATLPLLLAASTNTDAHPPTLIFTGATASVKGSGLFAAFATMKFALRAMAQSLAREMGPKGVHVAHVVVDGVIDTPGTKGRDMGEGEKIDPVAVSTCIFCWFLGERVSRGLQDGLLIMALVQ